MNYEIVDPFINECRGVDIEDPFESAIRVRGSGLGELEVADTESKTNEFDNVLVLWLVLVLKLYFITYIF